MKHILFLLTAVLLTPLAAVHAADDGITWLIHYDGKSLPDAPWTDIGKPNAKLEEGSLHLSDDSKDDMGAFEAEWKGDLEGKEIIVEARVKLVSMVGHRDSPTATWPQRDGAPICVQVCDGNTKRASCSRRRRTSIPRPRKAMCAR